MATEATIDTLAASAPTTASGSDNDNIVNVVFGAGAVVEEAGDNSYIMPLFYEQPITGEAYRALISSIDAERDKLTQDLLAFRKSSGIDLGFLAIKDGNGYTVYLADRRDLPEDGRGGEIDLMDIAYSRVMYSLDGNRLKFVDANGQFFGSQVHAKYITGPALDIEREEMLGGNDQD